jgi:hypothetical protein
MCENQLRSRLEVSVRRAEAVAERFHKTENDLILDAASNGRLGSSRLEIIILEAAKEHYEEACIGMIRDNGGMMDGLPEALAQLELQFHRRPDNGGGAYGKRFDPGFPSHLSKIRDDLLEDLKYGLFDMGKNERGSIIINQSGQNNTATAAGDNSTVSVSVAYSNIQHLIPAAMDEARALPISEDDRHTIIDHIQAIEDESKKSTPDDSRLKRMGRRLAADLGAAKDAAIAAGASAVATGGVEKLLSAIFS